jgi:hypothetical protein
MQGLCLINADRGTFSLYVPNLGLFSGTPAQLAAWLASFCEVDPPSPGAPNLVLRVQNYALADFSLSNTVMKGTIEYLFTEDYEDPTYGVSAAVHCEYTFNFSISLGGAVTFAEDESSAIGLLDYIDFTNDKNFPWLTDGDCRISPMISFWEKAGSPGVGYCEAPAAGSVEAFQLAQSLATYDGSIRGALLDYYYDDSYPPKHYKTGIYDAGWFDFAGDFYEYITDPDAGTCGSKSCYNYGYAPSAKQGVSMATQLVPGVGDTSDCPGRQPFTRYFVNWGAPVRPPFIDVSCGYVADGGDAVYASKYAEKTVPLESQKFFGPCGQMRNQTLLDANCNGTSTLRFPGAWSICGKCAVASITRDSGSGVVTVTLTDPADALIDGDAVDFLDASNNVTTANVTASHVDSPTQFHFTGALPTGVAIKSHGAPDPAWADPSPKGDFVWAFDSGNAYDAPGTPDVQSVQQDNLAKTGGILFVGPPGSPEITNPASAAKWPSATTRIMSTCYATIEPGGHSYCQPVQAMEDRFFTPQDNTMNDSSGGAPGICIALVPRPLPRWVEARLTAPAHAPFDFSGGDGNKYLKLPVAAELCYNFNCSGIWNATFAFTSLPYGSWPGAIKSSGALASQDVTGALASQDVTGASASDDITNLGPA